MALNRSIEKLEDGTYYADKIGMFYRDADEARNITFYADPDSMYTLVHDAIAKMANLGLSAEDKKDPEKRKQNNLAKLIKVAVKGMLLMYGEQILDVLYGNANHPKPQKGDDILDFYTNQFTIAGISDLMKRDLVLYGRTDESDQTIIEVRSIITRPVAAPDSSAGAGPVG